MSAENKEVSVGRLVRASTRLEVTSVCVHEASNLTKQEQCASMPTNVKQMIPVILDAR